MILFFLLKRIFFLKKMVFIFLEVEIYIFYICLKIIFLNFYYRIIYFWGGFLTIIFWGLNSI